MPGSLAQAGSQRFTVTKSAAHHHRGPCFSIHQHRHPSCPHLSCYFCINMLASSSSGDSNFNSMKVCVRVRPLSQKETTAEAKTIIDVIDNNMLVFDPLITEGNDQYEYHGRRYKEIGKRANKNLQFVFDRVFNPDENNITVYQETTKDLVNSLLSGFNCSVFAYGSTGSGKTHTMLGSTDDPGIIFFTTMDLYKKLEEDDNKNLELSISYFEIYNEILYDLLDPTSRQALSVLEDSNKGMTVKNLSIHQPRDADHLIEMLEFGNKNRKQHPTDANAESSRSHAIFQISLRRKDFTAAQEMTIQQVSKMSLIDLAGSERATVAYKNFRSNSLHREGGNINKSLLTLRNCINALSSSTAKAGYIPYRSSKLTLILRDSLGGNCQTLMIATASPSNSHFEETHSTLLYAERAKGVQLNVRKNNITVNVQPRNYPAIIEQMSSENAKIKKTMEELKTEVQKYKTQAESGPIEPITSPREAIDMLHSVKNTLDYLFAQRVELRGKLLDCEHHIKMIDLRLMFRKLDNERIAALNHGTESDELKCASAYSQLNNQKLHYVNQQATLSKEVEENEEKINRFETDLLDKTNNDPVVRAYFTENHCHVQAKEVALGETHTANVLEDIFSHDDANKELVAAYNIFAYRSFCVLKGKGLLSEEMDAKCKSIVQKLEGKKSVVWKDAIETPKMAKMREKIHMAQLPIYLSAKQTPGDKRNLVAVQDITPLLHKIKNASPLRNVNQNQNVPRKNLGGSTKQQLGNTVTMTKSRRVAFVLPSARQFPKLEKENTVQFSGHSSYFSHDRRTPERQQNHQNFDLNSCSNRNSSTKQICSRRHTTFYPNETYGNASTSSNNSTAKSPFRAKNYSHNPSFRFNARR